MEIQQSEQMVLHDALKALADYRAAAGIRPVKSPARETALSGLENHEEGSAQPIPSRLGRYVNILA